MAKDMMFYVYSEQENQENQIKIYNENKPKNRLFNLWGLLSKN